jgi:hypothetical protein
VVAGGRRDEDDRKQNTLLSLGESVKNTIKYFTGISPVDRYKEPDHKELPLTYLPFVSVSISAEPKVEKFQRRHPAFTLKLVFPCGFVIKYIAVLAGMVYCMLFNFDCCNAVGRRTRMPNFCSRSQSTNFDGSRSIPLSYSFK